MRLYCDVDASPEAEIAWLKSTPGEVCDDLNDEIMIALIICSVQEEQVLASGPELIINGVKRGDAGKWVGCGWLTLLEIRVNIVPQACTIVWPRTPGVSSTSHWRWKSTVSCKYCSPDVLTLSGKYRSSRCSECDDDGLTDHGD